MENTNQKEQEIIAIIKEHYQICDGKPRPLNALKKHYGTGFKFESLGLGKYGIWMHQHSHLFLNDQKAAEIVENIDIDGISEQQLLTTVTLFFSQSEYYTHRRHVLNHIRDIYGNRPFGKRSVAPSAGGACPLRVFARRANKGKFGFGTFKEFMIRHNLDIGIARRQDFRSLAEWKSWKGRKE